MKLFFIFIVLLFSFQLLAQNSIPYLSTYPLGKDFEVAEEKEGPIGSLLVPAPGTGKKGNKSIGVGASLIKFDGGKLYQYSLSLSYTPADKLDLVFAIPHINLKINNVGSENITGDFFAGIKHTFLENDYKAGFSVGFVFPTGGNLGLGDNNKMDIIVDLPIERKFNTIQVNMNIGYMITDRNSIYELESYKFGFALSKTLTEKIGVSAEVSYQKPEEGSSSTIYAFGLKNQINEKNSISCIIGKDSHSNGLDLLASLSYSRNF
ncbi:MAG TPA: hypothetical protein PLD27_13355 [bacterium]|nr:hypothetical protein [bacterium]HPQ20129.1 hypothetical protein [bacterium]